MDDMRLAILALVVTGFFALMVILQTFLNRQVWPGYLVGLVASAVTTVLVWPGIGR